MKSKIVRLNEEEINILEAAIKAQLRVCDPNMIERSPDDQIAVDIYARKLKKILGKLFLASD